MGRKALTNDQWLAKAKAVHPHIDFTNTVYAAARMPVTTQCAEHGAQTWSSPKGFLTSTRGCHDCAVGDMAEGKRKGAAHFLRRASDTHGAKYAYPMHDYVGMRNPVTIHCREHGAFSQIANKHAMGTGCPECTKGAGGASRRNNAEVFFSQAHKMHGDKYDYAPTEYRGMAHAVRIGCRDCGQVFEQKPIYHVTGSGCQSCAPAGFDPSKPATLYYLRVAGGLYKIGITNRSVGERFRLDAVEIVDAVLIESGAYAREIERAIIEGFAADRYQGPDVLSSGNTELFTRDVLGLDNR